MLHTTFCGSWRLVMASGNPTKGVLTHLTYQVDIKRMG